MRYLILIISLFAFANIFSQNSTDYHKSLISISLIQDQVIKPNSLSDSLQTKANDSITQINDTLFKPIPNDRAIGDNGFDEMEKDPYTAMAWSILPGGGQFYNESYLKAGLFLASASLLTGLTAYNYSKFLPLQDKYDSNLEIINKLPEDDLSRVEFEQENTSLLSRKEVFRDNAHLSLFFLGISYFIATMDAYVGAHLYGFEVEDDLQIGFLPQVGGGLVHVSYRF